MPHSKCLLKTLKTWLIQSHPCCDYHPREREFSSKHLLYFFQIVKEQQPFLIQRSKLSGQRLALHSLKLVEVDGIEPTTPCLQSRCSPS